MRHIGRGGILYLGRDVLWIWRRGFDTSYLGKGWGSIIVWGGGDISYVIRRKNS